MKKKLFLLLCLLLILIPVSVWGGEIVIQDGVRYDIEGEEAIASCRKEGNTSEKITIYDYVSIAHVIKIRNNAFMGDRYLTTLTVSDTITEIGVSAFSECHSLTTVTFVGRSKLQKIDRYAFSNCFNLTSITLSASVKTIEKGAFTFCKKLKVHYLGTKEQWEKIKGLGKPDISVVDFVNDSPSKSANPLKVRGKTVKVKKQKNLPVSKIISFKNKGKGKLSYSISSVNRGGKRYFKINSKTGRLTILKVG